MEFLKYSAFALIGIYGLIFLVVGIVGRKPIRFALVNVLSGVLALVVINLTARFTGVHIAVNEWTVGAGSAFGVTGVCGILLLKLIFGV